MTSFGAGDILSKDGFFTTFKIQGQVYHKIGSLFPMPDELPKFVQVFFQGTTEDEAKQRQRNIHGETLNLDIIRRLQEMLHEHHSYVKLFKYALEQMEHREDCEVVIRPDKKPSGEHTRRYNTPSTDEVAIIITGEQYGSRDIVLQKRSGELKRIAETHRAYDALQYPLILWKGQDGYNFEIKQINPQTGQETGKSVSCKHVYSFHLMERDSNFNHLLRFDRVFCQMLVDIYAKIESERICFIKNNQNGKLRILNY